MSESFETIFTADQIAKRVKELAAEISKTIGGGNLMCVVVLRGGFLFAADLVRELSGFDRIDVDFVTLSSYAGIQSSGEVKIRGHLPQVAGHNVLVIEDLVDTGHTLHTLHQALIAMGANSVRYAVLVNKPHRRERNIKPDFSAFELKENRFLVGYGMDCDGDKRTLPYIAALKEGKKST